MADRNRSDGVMGGATSRKMKGGSRAPPSRGARTVLRVDLPERVDLAVPRYRQPDDVTCGPTCLLQVLHYFEDRRSFPEVLAGTDRNPDGGTLAVFLGIAAIGFGYEATMYPFGLRVFDPTWFELGPAEIRAKLLGRAGATAKKKTSRAAKAYASFLEQGGRLVFVELSATFLAAVLSRGHPILCGLSSTWLYRQARERPDTMENDDVGGEPTGHFVVVCGYEDRGESFLVCDPSPHAPFGEAGRYAVPARRLIHSILLGELTYDAVLLEICPRPETDSTKP